MKISVIIPTYNEKSDINATITHLYASSKDTSNFEVIVADKSTDGTLNSITNRNVTKLTCTTKGRAQQMNEGASIAQNEIFYFLHSDSLPPLDWDCEIIRKTNSNFQFGCFRMKFDSKHWLLILSSWLTQFNVMLCRGGDQSLFITEKLFKKIKGFGDDTLFEDIEIIKNGMKFSKFGIIPAYILTSDRRYKSNGVFYLQYHFALLHLKYRLGVSITNLKRQYLKNIQ